MNKKKKISVNIFINILLTFLFVVISILFVMIIQGERSKNKLLMEYEIERQLFELSEEVRLGKKDIELPSRVFELGLYDENGNAVRRYGNAPANINLENLKQEKPSFGLKRNTMFFLDKKHATLKLIRWFKRRPLQLPIHPPQSPSSRISRIAVKGEPGVVFFYIVMDVKSYWQREQILSLAMVLVLIFIGISLLYIQYIYRKNVKYERKLKEQEQLVHLGEAARTLSHEIKNPLGAIKLRADVLKRYTLPEGRVDLEVISEEVNRLKSLTDRIHDFLKNPVGEPEEIDLEDFVGEMVRRSGYFIEIEKKFDGNNKLTIFFDRKRLYSVVDNLLRNAYESGSKKEDISIKLHCSKSSVYMEIMDRGDGIKNDIIDKVFNPFFTTKSQGSGIGLSITKRFVEASGGSIYLEQRMGGGTIVRVVFRGNLFKAFSKRK